MSKLPEYFAIPQPEPAADTENTVCQEKPQTITLHFVDELTGRTATYDFPRGCQCRDVMDRLNREGFLYLHGFSYVIREFSHYIYDQAIDRIPLHNNDLLHVEMRGAEELRKSGSFDRFLEEYTVIVEWAEESSWGSKDNSRSAKILCYGFHTKAAIEDALEKHFPPPPESIAMGPYKGFRIDYDSWPEYRRHPNGENEKLIYLCQLSPQREIHVLAKRRKDVEQPFFMAPLYGCPTAKGLRDAVGALHCDVEIVSYE